MPTSIVVPNLGPSIEEAVLVKWLVSEGDFVQRGTPIFSVETDKTVVDCESVDEGYLHRIDVPEGATVRVDQVLGELTAEKSEAPARKDERRENPPAPRPTEEARSGAPAEASAGPQAGERIRVLGDALADRDRAADSGRIRISPRARKMAREVGVAIERLPGTGPAGRIVGRDVETFVKSAVGAGSGARPAANRTVGSTGARDVPLTGMRRTIARRMTESARDAPVFFATTKVAADQLLQVREQLNRATDARVSINDIIVKACALALKGCPQINATFHGDRLRLHDDVDIAVAVAVEDGLVTPVVRNADRKDLVAISGEIRDLAERARLGKLAPAEYQGGTFTISNLGMYGVSEFTAIINPPQCAILAVGAIDRELYLEAGAARERRIVKVTLGADHRAIDGAMSARFLADLRAILEDPAPKLL